MVVQVCDLAADCEWVSAKCIVRTTQVRLANGDNMIVYDFNTTVIFAFYQFKLLQDSSHY